MSELALSQVDVRKLTGIGASSISQYLSGKNEPSEARKKEIARALGVQEDYFNQFLPETKIQHDGVVNLPVPLAAKLMGKSEGWIRQGLRDRVFPWGYAVKMKEWSYYISSVKFTEYTGIEIPWNEVA